MATSSPQRQARINEDGSIRIKSSTSETLTYRVTFKPIGGWLIQFSCTCQAGMNSKEVVPCKHAKKAAERLVRERVAVKQGNWWFVHPRLRG